MFIFDTKQYEFYNETRDQFLTLTQQRLVKREIYDFSAIIAKV